MRRIPMLAALAAIAVALPGGARADSAPPFTAQFRAEGGSTYPSECDTGIWHEDQQTWSREFDDLEADAPPPVSLSTSLAAMSVTQPAVNRLEWTASIQSGATHDQAGCQMGFAITAERAGTLSFELDPGWAPVTSGYDQTACAPSCTSTNAQGILWSPGGVRRASVAIAAGSTRFFSVNTRWSPDLGWSATGSGRVLTMTFSGLRITGGPAALTDERSPVFAWEEAGLDPAQATPRYECRLEAGPPLSSGGQWDTCTSPKALSDLAAAAYTFYVRRADDGTGHPGPAIARSFSVLKEAPAAAALPDFPGNLGIGSLEPGGTPPPDVIQAAMEANAQALADWAAGDGGSGFADTGSGSVDVSAPAAGDVDVEVTSAAAGGGPRAAKATVLAHASHHFVAAGRAKVKLKLAKVGKRLLRRSDAIRARVLVNYRAATGAGSSARAGVLLARGRAHAVRSVGAAKAATAGERLRGRLKLARKARGTVRLLLSGDGVSGKGDVAIATIRVRRQRSPAFSAKLPATLDGSYTLLACAPALGRVPRGAVACTAAVRPVAIAAKPVSAPAVPALAPVAGDGAASASIGPDGGSLTAGALKLVIPAGALAVPTQVTLTPLQSIGGLPLVAGAILTPDVALRHAAVLRLRDGGGDPAIAFAADGARLRLTPAAAGRVWLTELGGAAALIRPSAAQRQALATLKPGPRDAFEHALGRVILTHPAVKPSALGPADLDEFDQTFTPEQLQALTADAIAEYEPIMDFINRIATSNDLDDRVADAVAMATVWMTRVALVGLDVGPRYSQLSSALPRLKEPASRYVRNTLCAAPDLANAGRAMALGGLLVRSQAWGVLDFGHALEPCMFFVVRFKFSFKVTGPLVVKENEPPRTYTIDTEVSSMASPLPVLFGMTGNGAAAWNSFAGHRVLDTDTCDLSSTTAGPMEVQSFTFDDIRDTGVTASFSFLPGEPKGSFECDTTTQTELSLAPLFRACLSDVVLAGRAYRLSVRAPSGVAKATQHREGTCSQTTNFQGSPETVTYTADYSVEHRPQPYP